MSACVYVMQDADGFMKVGVSSSIDRRVKAIKSDRKCAVSVVWMTALREDAVIIEAIAHATLLPRRQEMEWFDISMEEAISAIVVAIERVEAGDIARRRRLPCNYARTVPRLGAPLTVHIHPSVLADIKIAAANDRRSASNLIRKILRDWVSAREAGRA